jgi:hypothetical protein
MLHASCRALQCRRATLQEDDHDHAISLPAIKRTQSYPCGNGSTSKRMVSLMHDDSRRRIWLCSPLTDFLPVSHAQHQPFPSSSSPHHLSLFSTIIISRSHRNRRLIRFPSLGSPVVGQSAPKHVAPAMIVGVRSS